MWFPLSRSPKDCKTITTALGNCHLASFTKKTLPALLFILQKIYFFAWILIILLLLFFEKLFAEKWPDIFQIYSFGMGCSASSCAPGDTKKHIARFYLSFIIAHTSLESNVEVCITAPDQEHLGPKGRTQRVAVPLKKWPIIERWKGKVWRKRRRGKVLKIFLDWPPHKYIC